MRNRAAWRGAMHDPCQPIGTNPAPLDPHELPRKTPRNARQAKGNAATTAPATALETPPKLPDFARKTVRERGLPRSRNTPRHPSTGQREWLGRQSAARPPSMPNARQPPVRESSGRRPEPPPGMTGRAPPVSPFAGAGRGEGTGSGGRSRRRRHVARQPRRSGGRKPG